MQICWILLAFLAIFTISCQAHSISARNYNETLMFSELKLFSKSGSASPALLNLIDHFAMPENLKNHYWSKNVGPKDDDLCLVCKSVINVAIELYNEGHSIEDIKESITLMCVAFKIYNEPVCQGVINLVTPTFKYILEHDKTVGAEEVCGLRFQSSDCISMPERYKWSINIDQGPLRQIERNKTNEQFKIIHMTDLHYDPKYEPFGAAECGMPTCCRKGQKHVGEEMVIAGYWGDYHKCDTPWHAAVDAMDHIKETNKDIEIIYYTGDLVDHGEWETTVEGNREIVIKSFEQMKKTFGDLPLYPILGNHEANPLNVFSSANILDGTVSTNWLYEIVADIWIGYGWLPESTKETILRGGYYTVTPKKGFRIIALNNNAGYTSNWWLLYEPKDLGGQLQWFHDTLLEAEKNDELVHILAHLPAGSTESQYTWSLQYNRIINRFAHIITGQFNGHTHNDEFNLFYDLDDLDKPINVAWNGGSITTWAWLNPNYKIYQANANTYAIEEAESWIYNLTEANETPEKRPRWFKSYSFKEEYQVSDLSPKTLDSLLKTWCVEKSEPLKKYHSHFNKDAPFDQVCDKSCLNKLVCRIATTITGDITPCNHLKC